MYGGIFFTEKIFIHSAVFIFIIVLAYVLKQRHFFRVRDMQVLSKIFVTISMPCVIITNFAKLDFDPAMLWIVLLGAVFNILSIGASFLLPEKDGGHRAVNLLELSGYNIGGFVMPFAFAFAGPMGIVGASLFDVGNSIMCTGATYTIAEHVKYGHGSLSPLYFLRKLLQSLPFDAYLLMIILHFLHWQLPPFVMELSEICGNGNTLVTLLMIGIALDLDIDMAKFKQIGKINVCRLLLGCLYSVFVLYALPFSMEVRQIIVISLFSPITFFSTACILNIGEDAGTASSATSVSIFLSIIISTVLMLSMGLVK